MATHRDSFLVRRFAQIRIKEALQNSNLDYIEGGIEICWGGEGGDILANVLSTRLDAPNLDTTEHTITARLLVCGGHVQNSTAEEGERATN